MRAAERANARRSSWTAEIVRACGPKPALLVNLSYEQRLVNVTALVRRACMSGYVAMQRSAPDGWGFRSPSRYWWRGA